MTSPIRDYSFVEGEKLSPIKLDSSSFSVHPHGLAAKHGARRNTIHALVDRTPINKSKDSVPFRKTAADSLYTSPRRNRNTHLSYSKSTYNPIRKFHEIVDHHNKAFETARNDDDTTLGKSSDKENTTTQFKFHDLRRSSNEQVPLSLFDSSPSKGSRSINPLKRPLNEEQGEKPTYQKLAKVVTNANDSLFTNDTVFSREDLVGQIGKARKKTTVIDNDTDDSDLEIRNSGAEELSHSNTLHTRKLLILENHTNTGNIISENNNDYITPQRPTEPIAHSPSTSQSSRVAEKLNNKTKNTASPLGLINLEGYKISSAGEIPSNTKSNKLDGEPISIVDDHDDIDNQNEQNPPEEEEEEEPTINFLMSPNSKPIFSVDYIKKIQNSNADEIFKLESEIRKRKNEILKFSEELASTNAKFLQMDEHIRELEQENKLISTNEDLIKIQLKHTERELAKSLKTLKLRQNYVSQIEARDLKYKEQLNSTLADLKEAQLKISLMEEKLEENDKQLLNEKANYELKKKQILELEHQNMAKSKKIDSLLEKSQDQKEKLTYSLKVNEDLIHESELLKKENDELLAINDKQSGLVEELDKLETLAKDKIENLEATVKKYSEKIEQLEKEKEQEKIKNEEEFKLQQNLLEQATAAIEEAENSRKKAVEKYNSIKTEVESSNESNSKLRKEIDELKSSKELINEDLLKARELIEKLQSSNEEKQLIISQDTKKFEELMEIVNSQKQSILKLEDIVEKSERNAEAVNQEKNSDNEKIYKENKEFKDEIEILKAELKLVKEDLAISESKVKIEVDKVAESLYYQYSKKHELKVAEVRKSMERRFRKQIDHLELRTKSQNRDIESLEKKLETVNAEKTQLLSYVDGYKEREEARRKSPKRNNTKRF